MEEGSPDKNEFWMDGKRNIWEGNGEEKLRKLKVRIRNKKTI